MVDESISFRPLEALSQSLIPKKKEDIFVEKDTFFKGVIRNESNKEFHRDTVLERLKRNNVITFTCRMTKNLLSESDDESESEEKEHKEEKEKENKKDIKHKKIKAEFDDYDQIKEEIQEEEAKVAKPLMSDFDMEVAHESIEWDEAENPTTFIVCSTAEKEKKPGKAPSEHLSKSTHSSEFDLLASIPDWRNQLCNSYEAPFECNGKQWKSVEHYMMEQKTNDTIEKRSELYHALYAKFSQYPDLAKTLYFTKNAKILYRINKQKKEEFWELMWLRQQWRNYLHSLFKTNELPLSKKKKKTNVSPDLTRVNISSLQIRMPISEKQIIRAPSYYLTNRAQFVKRINELLSIQKPEKDKGSFPLLSHQEIVRDYINLYTPYRGVLLYHGLGSGKTCTSIAIAEALKMTMKRIFVFLPASLKTNFWSELEKCADQIYNKHKYWEFVSIEKEKPEMIEQLAKALTLSTQYIEKKKGAWLIDARKPSNYEQLTEEQQKSLANQIQAMISKKYTNIHYNAPNLNKIIKELESGGKNPFDNSVLIIDEAHNFISRILGKLKNKKLQNSVYSRLYNLIMNASNTRIVLLSGTPIINSPHEMAVMFNLLRGYINTWKFSIEKNTNSRVDSESLTKLFMENGLTSFDYIHISRDNMITITRNPFGFVRSDKKQKYTMKKNLQEKRQTQRNTDVEEYNGIQLDETGNITNEKFVQMVTKILKNNDMPLKIGSKPELKQEKLLPDDKDIFREMFMKETTTISGKEINETDLIHINILKARIMGLTSYFRSAREETLPTLILNENNETYHELKIQMSDYQFQEYAKIRTEERIEESRRKKRIRTLRNQVNSGDILEVSSTFRIFSRSCCNFSFPVPPSRPIPSNKKKTENEELDENEVEGKILEEMKEEDDPVVEDETYLKRIESALSYMEENKKELLTSNGLKTYSPKFLELLSQLNDVENKGCHLLYSNFRTLEGIGIFKLVLLTNDWVELKVLKVENRWDISGVEEENKHKKKFVLYTGTESEEIKEMVRNIYNGTWDRLPSEISTKILKIAENNLYGQLVKLFMITSAGAEGINLRNTRFVHIMEPYWHNVRLEQVVGRARRIGSHMDLPPLMRTVKVFLYISTMSESQRKDDQYKELILNDISIFNEEKTITTDEFLYEVSQVKQKINKQFLRVIKETAMDCMYYTSKNKNPEQLVCFNSPQKNTNEFSSYPQIQMDMDLEKI